MCVTDSGIVIQSSSSELLKAPSPIFESSEGIFTPKYPCVWTSSSVAVSTSFLVYVTVTSASPSNNPAASSVLASSMMHLSPSNSSALKTFRSIGSSQGCVAMSIVFNSRTVAVTGTSTVNTPPSKVFKLTSVHDMAGRKCGSFRVFGKKHHARNPFRHGKVLPVLFQALPFWVVFFSNKPGKLQSRGCLTANSEMIYNPCVKHNAKVPKGSCCSFHNFHIYYIYTYTY